MNLFDPIEQDPSPKNILPKEGEVFLFKNYFPKVEADDLFNELKDNCAWQQETIRMYDKMLNIPRLTAWYGDPERKYSYSGIEMSPHPWTDVLLGMKNRIENEFSVKFNSVLLNYYRTGNDSVAWHSDDEPELGVNPTIGSVSLGAMRAFRLRNIADRSLVERVELGNGSFLLMKGETQHKWQHEIPKSKKNVGGRINLTFRYIN
jgi:alkylated DNA repair dioxygenase AlkB